MKLMRQMVLFAMIGFGMTCLSLQVVSGQERDDSVETVASEWLVGDIRFEEANRMVLEKDYAGAIGLYQQVLKDHDSANLNHNLGIAYYLNGDSGLAVLHFERALRQGFNSTTTREILSLLRNSEGIVDPSYTLFQRLARTLPEFGWILLLTVSFWSMPFFGLYLYGMLKKVSVYRDVAVVSLVVFGISIAAVFGLEQDSQHGVLVGDENGLKIVPTVESEVFLTLKGGEMARYLKSNGGYVFLETSSGVRGWVVEDQFARIRLAD